jgi:uncharacterized protein (DUF2252 family)
MRPFANIATVFILGGCTSESIPARAAWIQQQLAKDNQVWLDRDPDLVAEKFQKMAGNGYYFMRGTTSLFYADVAQVYEKRSSTQFLSTEDAGLVMMVGDPHPENFGTLPATEFSDEPMWGWTDLDASTYGPYLLDLRRLVQGTLVMARPLSGCGNTCLYDIAEDLSVGYAEEIQNLTMGKTTKLESAILDDVLDEALEEGFERKRFFKYTESIDEQEVRLRRFEPVRPLEKAHRDLTDTQTQQLAALMADFNRQNNRPVRLLDAVRRFGTGVNSYPAIRYIVQVDHGEPGPDDDVLLGVREMRNPAGAPVPTHGQPTWADNGERISFLSTHLWPHDEGDRMFRGLREGPMAFRSRSYLSWSQEIDHEKVAEAWRDGDIDAGDLARTANMLGRALAQAHAGGKTARGTPALKAIAKDIAKGGGQAFVRERIRDSASDIRDLERDQKAFTWLLSAYGPLLGTETILEDEL